MIPIQFRPRVARVERTGQDAPHAGRRHALKSMAVLSGMLVAGSALGLAAPSLAWALEVKHLNQAQADSVLALVKTLYPHAKMPDAVYALAVKDIDEWSATDDGKTVVADGIRRIDAKGGRGWTKASAKRRHDLVAANIEDPYVQKVRARCLTSLYDNELAYTHFGYQGEAFSKGGYIFRGFNDLTWLPDPPASASPPVVA